ncbi:MAG: DUF4328 domain-containing protein [Flavobacteriaceae bacterium]
MTDVQLQYCKKCLNRKRGETDPENICNIRGMNMKFEGVCTSFELDENVTIGLEKKTDKIKPNEHRARIAQTLIWIVMALDILSVYSSYLQYSLLNAFQNNEEVSEIMINTNDYREQGIAILYLIAFFISGITFIQWFRRAYYNLGTITSTDDSEGWAAGSWFVPVISIYRPYQIMKEMNDKTIGILKTKTTDYVEDNSQLIGVWWGLWVVSNYIGKYVTRYAFKDDSVETLINATGADMVLSLIGIPLAFVTVKVIKTYAKKEAKLSEIANNS